MSCKYYSILNSNFIRAFFSALFLQLVGDIVVRAFCRFEHLALTKPDWYVQSSSLGEDFLVKSANHYFLTSFRRIFQCQSRKTWFSSKAPQILTKMVR